MTHDGSASIAVLPGYQSTPYKDEKSPLVVCDLLADEQLELYPSLVIGLLLSPPF
jgi:hypothetical protein